MTTSASETANETSNEFQDIVRENDLYAAKSKLRKYGLRTGNEKVANDFSSEALRTFGGGTKGALT